MAILLSSVTGVNGTAIATNAVENTPIVEAASAQILSQKNSQSKSAAATTSVETYVRAYFEETPILAEVARCESRFRQHGKDGEVLRGMMVDDDLGVMQINDYFHGKTADKLGLDLHTLEGNLAYAKYLYEKQGLQPWSASAPCWDK
ncbi:MAG: hypothetical protein V4519_02585 [Patescibacteria group bacterium]